MALREGVPSQLQGLLSTAQDLYVSLASCLCRPDASIKLNGRTFKLLKLLGEGGFSFVYLAEDTESGRLFALKKIRCTLGSESLEEVMREVEASKRFRHPNCIRCLDSCVQQEADGKVVYLFLPFFERGNVQDAISAHAINGTSFPEKEILHLFLGACRAVQAMHNYVAGPVAVYPPNAGPLAGQNTDVDDTALDPNIQNEQEGLIHEMEHQSTGHRSAPNQYDAEAADDEAATRMARPKSDRVKEGEVQPWAHRDIKPANVMISDKGQAVLMDFGSAIPARLKINNRQEALAEQDRAAEHSTMPYRAPELFDVRTGMLDEKVDIWSLGCTLYAMAYGQSPFESGQDQGASVALAVQNNAWKFPSNNKGYSEGLRNLVSSMLITDPSKRPDIETVIQSTRSCLERLQ